MPQHEIKITFSFDQDKFCRELALVSASEMTEEVIEDIVRGCIVFEHDRDDILDAEVIE